MPKGLSTPRTITMTMWASPLMNNNVLQRALAVSLWFKIIGLASWPKSHFIGFWEIPNTIPIYDILFYAYSIYLTLLQTLMCTIKGKKCAMLFFQKYYPVSLSIFNHVTLFWFWFFSIFIVCIKKHFAFYPWYLVYVRAVRICFVCEKTFWKHRKVLYR